MRYAYLFSQVFNTPLLIHPDKLAAIWAVIGPRYGSEPTSADLEAQAAAANARAGERKPYILTSDGVAIIPIIGTLVPRVSGLDALSGLTSYQRIGDLINRAAKDQDVTGILLEVDSHGGSASGCFALAERIRAVAAQKPVWAFANEVAYSAGYALAASAERLILPESGAVGSIGVVAWHADRSRAEANQGVDWTPIYAGARKIDGNPVQPLTGEAFQTIKARIDDLYGIFVRLMAEHRGLAEEAIRSTEAGTYMGKAAVRNGLADGIGSFSSTLKEFTQHLKTFGDNGGLSARDNGRMDMSGKNADEPVKTEGAEPKAEAPKSNGAQEERARIKAITTCEEAKGRTEQAEYLAYETDMDAEQAKVILSKAPVERSDDGKDRSELSKQMATLKNPDVGLDNAPPDDGEPKPGAMAANMRSRLQQTGYIGGE